MSDSVGMSWAQLPMQEIPQKSPRMGLQMHNLQMTTSEGLPSMVQPGPSKGASAEGYRSHHAPIYKESPPAQKKNSSPGQPMFIVDVSSYDRVSDVVESCVYTYVLPAKL